MELLETDVFVDSQGLEAFITRLPRIALEHSNRIERKRGQIMPNILAAFAGIMSNGHNLGIHFAFRLE